MPPPGARGGRVIRGSARSILERYVRRSWGDPGRVLRALAVVYGAAADLRNLLWEAGLFRPVRLAVPVISVGGLSTGGSAKTPLTAALARHLADARHRVAVVTPGQRDELDLHAALNPDVPVLGGRWRIPVARAAIGDGAKVVLLDSGFQHRRLHRDLEIVACNVDQAGNRERLPAGPYRERFTALSRADGVVLVRRVAPRGRSDELAEEVRGLAEGAHLAQVALRPGGMQAANAAATRLLAGGGDPDPAVAVAGVMWPESFFRSLSPEGVRPVHRVALRDHARYEEDTVRELVDAAGERGIVCTRKDAVRLAPRVPEDVPVWWLAEEVGWESGAERLLAGVRHAAGTPDAARGSPPGEGRDGTGGLRAGKGSA